MKYYVVPLLFCTSLIVTLPVANSIAEELRSEFISKGVTQKVGGYRPVQVEMDQEASIAKVAPTDLESPKYGMFEIGGKNWAFILDEHAEGDGKLYIDTNVSVT